eukprot:COSAG01_NODE_2238_length_8089_cov_5.948936_7_plen_85_part_00
MLPPPQDTRLGARIRCFRPDHQNETSEVVQLTMLSNGRPTFKVGGGGAAVRGDRGACLPPLTRTAALSILGGYNQSGAGRLSSS